MIRRVLRECRPDFVQYDSKGHPGYLGFPSETGMSAPGIVQDSLALWRRVTAEEGVALYNHFSGVLDGLAVEKHPEWARVGPDEKRDAQETSTFSAYERELMIRELKEAALKYDLDGSWVDGDCWAVKPDYCEASVRTLQRKTEIQEAPKGHTDKGWNEFLEIQREQFRHYVETYVEELHRAKPGYQITSNWMYSTFAPEKPEIGLDYLSGDVAGGSPMERARMEARYFASTGKTWDLMSWGFETDAHLRNASAKPAVALEQEAATVIAQGGAYQIYYVPSRAGWIDDRVIKTAAKVASFCRERQAWCHQSESIPDAAVLLSGRSLYRTANRVFGSWGDALRPAEGALEALLACGYSVDVLPDWKANGALAQYPLVIVPDWKDVGSEVADAMTRYTEGGGRLLVIGAANAQLFSDRLGVHVSGAAGESNHLIADDTGFASLPGEWAELHTADGEVVEEAYREADSRKDKFGMAVRVRRGKGTAVVCGAPLASGYGAARSPVIRAVMRRLAVGLREPVVQIDGEFPEIEVVLRKKSGAVLVHLVNSAGAAVSGEFRDWGAVPRTGAIRLHVRMKTVPPKAAIEPGNMAVSGEYSDGVWSVTVPDVHVHTIMRLEGAEI
jgi:hypothetical protein